jgi:hypothetical protein
LRFFKKPGRSSQNKIASVAFPKLGRYSSHRKTKLLDPSFSRPIYGTLGDQRFSGISPFERVSPVLVVLFDVGHVNVG